MKRTAAPFHYAWVILGLGVAVVFSALGLARFGYTSVLPAMQEGLNISNTQAGGLATFNLVGYLLVSAVGGALAARYGPRAVITAGLVLAGGGMLMTGFAEGYFLVALWRGVTGCGSGASNVPVMGLMASWFGRRRRGFASGIAATGSSVALIVLGPSVPFLLAAFGDGGWRVCWFVFGGVTLAVAAAAVAFLRNRPGEKGLHRLGDGAGTPPVPVADTGMAGDAAVPLPGIGEIYRSRRVWFLGAVYSAFGFSYIIYVTFYVKHLMAAGGYTAEGAGAMYMLVGWLSLACGVLWGAVSDRIGRGLTLAVVYVLQAGAFGLFALWSAPAGFIISTLLFGLTAWSIPAVMAATCGDALGGRRAPAALGFITLFFGIGQAAGPSIAGAIADATGSFSPAFLLAAVVALCGGAASMFIRA